MSGGEAGTTGDGGCGASERPQRLPVNGNLSRANLLSGIGGKDCRRRKKVMIRRFFVSNSVSTSHGDCTQLTRHIAVHGRDFWIYCYYGFTSTSLERQLIL
jgi:hypothetical protein